MTPNDSKLHQTQVPSGARRSHHLRRGSAVVGLAALLVASAQLATAVVTTALTGPLRAPGDLDEAVGLVAAVGAGAVLLTWTCGAAVTAAALAARAAGRTSARLDALSTALTPLLLRRVLAAAVGAAALGGVTGPALAAPAAAPPAATAAAAAEVPLTWPASPAPTPSASTPLSPTPTGPASAGGAPRGPREVVVASGDTLWGVAARSLPPGATAAEVAQTWPRWYRANRAVIGADPDLLRPGQRLLAPPVPERDAA
ncbi:LysM peptidoglycan-binding domain-containing protein [Quadrisphaera sp. INWT6]|uniref:LysM peptidoglycan-binding domain-containing protein n=1 Tax=Quadrisphaera sp. INWT6 TaxID=2596917 RepID=UPI00189220B7|nr:LysM domain-containing protein [Quadrisphaera sp. INWT6]MBF5081409.1 LysM peptidoglycan-binding domain-containing protein [Quadrisphaera sp. INWT6]